MADISKIKALNGTTYNIKDAAAMKWPYQRALVSKTYTNVIATSNDNRGGGFFYLKVRANTWNSCWRIKVRVLATVPGHDLYRNDSIFEIWGFQNTYSAYSCNNHLMSTSYRPIYYHSHFRVSDTGYNNDCGGWIGFNLYNAQNNTSAYYKRTVVVDLLEYENCTVEMQDSLITPDNIPKRAAHTNYYSSTNTSFDNFDASSYGLKQSGDANTTTISNLIHGSGNFIADSAVYRYQLLFHVDENILTPLNNNSNTTGTTKTMLVNRTFDPFKEILYYNSTTTVAANASIGAGSCFFAINGVDLRYTFNITSTAFTAHKNVYLKVSPQNDGMVTIASANPLTQSLPTSDDGLWYVLLGRAYNGYSISLYPDHPVYKYDGESASRVLPTNATITDDTIFLRYSRPIASNTDLDDIQTPGTYIIDSATIADTLGHYPDIIHQNAKLIVNRNTGTIEEGWWGQQIILSGDDLCIRQHNDDSWFDWTYFGENGYWDELSNVTFASGFTPKYGGRTFMYRRHKVISFAMAFDNKAIPNNTKIATIPARLGVWGSMQFPIYNNTTGKPLNGSVWIEKNGSNYDFTYYGENISAQNTAFSGTWIL